MIETVISGTARIRPKADGTFRYGPEGEPATTLGVEDRYGNFMDVVAWGRDPCRWWLRRGETPILGARALAIAAWHGEPVKLNGHPGGMVAGAPPGRRHGYRLSNLHPAPGR